MSLSENSISAKIFHQKKTQNNKNFKFQVDIGMKNIYNYKLFFLFHKNFISSNKFYIELKKFFEINNYILKVLFEKYF